MIYKSHLPMKCFSMLIDPFINHQIQTIGFKFIWSLVQFPGFLDRRLDEDLRSIRL